MNAAVGHGIKKVTFSAALGYDTLQKFLAAQAGNFDADRRILGLKSVGDELAFIGAHGGVERNAAFFLASSTVLSSAARSGIDERAA
jgi:hypothetical protein